MNIDQKIAIVELIQEKEFVCASSTTPKNLSFYRKTKAEKDEININLEGSDKVDFIIFSSKINGIDKRQFFNSFVEVKSYLQKIN